MCPAILVQFSWGSSRIWTFQTSSISQITTSQQHLRSHQKTTFLVQCLSTIIHQTAVLLTFFLFFCILSLLTVCHVKNENDRVNCVLQKHVTSQTLTLLHYCWHTDIILHYRTFKCFPFSALMLMAGQKIAHPVCNKPAPIRFSF